MLIHNGDNPVTQRLKAMAPRVHIAALAPHVAVTARKVLKLDAEWAMAALPFKPKVSLLGEPWIRLLPHNNLAREDHLHNTPPFHHSLPKRPHPNKTPAEALLPGRPGRPHLPPRVLHPGQL